jgi:hypothetical protein
VEPVIVESKLAQAFRRVAKARQIVAWQCEIIAKRRAAGLDTTLAERSLHLFAKSLAIFEEDLLAIQREENYLCQQRLAGRVVSPGD